MMQVIYEMEAILLDQTMISPATYLNVKHSFPTAQLTQMPELALVIAIKTIVSLHYSATA